MARLGAQLQYTFIDVWIFFTESDDILIPETNLLVHISDAVSEVVHNLPKCNSIGKQHESWCRHHLALFFIAQNVYILHFIFPLQTMHVGEDEKPVISAKPGRGAGAILMYDTTRYCYIDLLSVASQ